MLGPSTGSLRCFRRCEDRAPGADLLFTMLSGAHVRGSPLRTVLSNGALVDDRSDGDQD